jgi:hypothetical protein
VWGFVWEVTYMMDKVLYRDSTPPIGSN